MVCTLGGTGTIRIGPKDAGPADQCGNDAHKYGYMCSLLSFFLLTRTAGDVGIAALPRMGGHYEKG
jgi:hypothetical protein